MDLQDFLNSLTDDQKAKLAKALTSDLPKQENKTPNKSSPQQSASVDDNFVMKKADGNSSRRKEPVRARRNEWEDTGEFRDIETPNFERTPRKRQPPKKVEVDCHVCGKSFKVDQRFVYGEYYRCNRCTGK